MITTYKIIADLDQINQLISILPDSSLGETFYAGLFARKKYCDIVGKNNVCLRRFTCNKETLISKLQQLECVYGAYQIDGMPLPQEAICCYIKPNPRSHNLALKKLAKACVDSICCGEQDISVHKLALNCLQDSPSRKLFVDFDFDGIEPNYSGYEEACHVIKTRGGVHILADIKKCNSISNSWYQFFRNQGSDIAGDCLLPIPGTYQGGAVVELRHVK